MDSSVSALMDLSQQQQQQQHHEQQDEESLTNQHSINGVGQFQDNGTNKRISKINPTNSDEPSSYVADLNDKAVPSDQEMARRNEFAKKRRKRTEKHIIAHAQGGEGWWCA